MKVHWRTACAALAAAGALLSGCDDAGGDRLSLDGMRKAASEVGEMGSGVCPLPYDVTAAAEEAGLKGDAGPGGARPGDDAPAATAEGGRAARPGEPLALNPGVLITCRFHVAEADLEIQTVVTEKPQAVSVMLPLIQNVSGMASGELGPYVERVAAAQRGEPVLPANGGAVTVRLPVAGEGDAVLVLAPGHNDDATLSDAQLTSLSERLAAQVS